MIMDRKEELLKLINHDVTLLRLVDEIMFLEERLIELKKLPFIKVHPTNPELQKATPAAKQYKEFLQQYTNCIRALSRVVGVDEDDEESPLRKWVKKRADNSK